MSRSPNVLTFPLNVDTTLNPVSKEIAGYRYLFVADMPASAQGLVFIGLDDGPVDIPVYRGDRWGDGCTGRDLQKVTVKSPALVGTLTLVASKEDAIPFAGGASSGLGPIVSRRILWPPPGILGIASAMTTSGEALGGNLVVLFDAAGAGTNMNLFGDQASAPLGGQLIAPKSTTLSLHSCYLPLVIGAVLAAQHPGQRVFRWRFALRLQVAAAATVSTNATLMVAQAGQPLFGSGSNNPGMGLAGDGAGKWKYVSRTAPGAAIQDSVALPFAVTDHVVWELVVLAATPTTPAEFQLWANDVQVVRKVWGTDPLPLYTAQGPNSARFQPTLEADDAGTTLQFAAMVCEVGNVLPNGALA